MEEITNVREEIAALMRENDLYHTNNPGGGCIYQRGHEADACQLSGYDERADRLTLLRWLVADVRRCGAKADGVTDDTPAFQRAARYADRIAALLPSTPEA